MEFEKDVDLETCAGSILQVTKELLTQWTKEKAIEGARAIDNSAIDDYYGHLDYWAIRLKAVVKNKHALTETMLEVKTNASAHAFYQHEKEYCNSNRVRVASKNTCMEYTKKLEFLTGTNVKLAAQNIKLNSWVRV